MPLLRAPNSGQRGDAHRFIRARRRTDLCVREVSVSPLQTPWSDLIPETRWDWSVLEPARDELSEGERDRLENAGPITESEMLDFHLRLAHMGNIADLSGNPKPRTKEKKSEASRPRFELKTERKDENREVRNRDGKRDAPNHDTRLNTNGSNGEVRPDDFPTSP